MLTLLSPLSAAGTLQLPAHFRGLAFWSFDSGACASVVGIGRQGKGGEGLTALRRYMQKKQNHELAKRWRSKGLINWRLALWCRRTNRSSATI
jgi:hypothetical protein